MSPNKNVFEPAQPQTALALNHVVNHECKALTYAALTDQGESTPVGLAKIIENRTDTNKAMRTSLVSYMSSFVVAGFASMELKIGETGREGKHFTATNHNEALPLVGSMLEWSEQHDESLVRVLGGSNSKSKNKSPMDTVQLFDGLLQELTINEMEPADWKARTGGHDAPHVQRLNKLIKMGLVVDENPAEFEIYEPKPRYHGSPLDSRKPWTKAAYQTLGIARKIDPDAKWTVEQIRDLAFELELIKDTPHHRRMLKLMITSAVSIKNNTVFRGFTSKIDVAPKYRVAEDFKEQANDLVERVKTIDTAGSRTKERFASQALEMFDDEETASRIFDRGIQNSPDFGKFDK